MLVGIQQFSIEFGIMISFWIDYGTNYIGGTGDTQSEAAWLVPLCLQLAPAIILFVGMLFMPYSPRWLVHHGREEEARRVIAKLRGKGASLDDEAVELEFLEIKAQSMFEKRSVQANFPHLAEQNWWNTLKLQFVAIGSLFRSMPMFRRVIVATVTMFFQQWTGINAVLYYAPTIFSELGMDSNTTSLLATGVVGIGKCRQPRVIIQTRFLTEISHACHYHSYDSLRRQDWTQDRPGHRCHRNGRLPHHHRGHLR